MRWHDPERYELLQRALSPQLQLARDSVSGEETVLKRGELSHLQAELGLLQRLAHPQLSRLHDVLWSPVAPALVLEYREGRDLREWVQGGPTVARVCSALLGLLPALRYLHRSGVVHGDLKPEHVLVFGATARPQVGVIDLGLARCCSDSGRVAAAGSGVGGTRGFIAPEVAAGGVLTDAADRYAIGAILHDVLLGEPPRLGEPARLTGLLDASRRGRRELSGALVELMSDLLAPTAELRPGLSTVSEVLAHVLAQVLPVAEEPARPALSMPMLQSPRQQRALGSVVEAMLGGAPLIRLEGTPPRGLEALGQLAAINDVQPLRLTSMGDLERWLGLSSAEASVERTAPRALEALLDRERAAPLLLICEALDEPLVSFAEHLARLVQSDPEHVTGRRQDDLELALVWRGEDPVARALETLGQRVVVPPLDRPEVEALVRSVVEHEALPAWTAALANGSRGEPRLLLAALRAQLQRGGASDQPLCPEAVAALGASSAIAALDQPERELLAVVALAAAPLGVAQLARIAPETIGALGSLGARELIVLDDRGVCLAPGLELRELVPAGRSAEDQRALHARIVEHLPPDAPPSVVGHHLLHAGRAVEAAGHLLAAPTVAQGDLELGCRELTRLGGPPGQLWALRRKRALERRAAGDLAGALELASDCGEQGETLAAELLLDAGQPALALERLQQLDLDRDPEAALISARAKVLQGDPGGAVGDARRGLRRAQEEPLRLRLDNALGLGLLYTGEVAVACETLEAALSRVQGAGQALDEPRSRLHNSLGMSYQQRARLDDAQRCYERALSGFRALGDLRLAATCALNLGTVAHQRGRLGEALVAYRRGRDLAQRAELGTTLGWALANEGNLLLDLGACDEASRCLEAAAGRAAQLGGGGLAAHVALYRGDLARQRGQLDQAEAWLAEARASFESADVQGRQAAALLAGELALHRREPSAVDQALQQLEQLRQGSGEVSAAALWLAARRQRLEGGGERRATELIERALELEAPEPPRFELLGFAAANAASLGQPERARELARACDAALSLWRAAVPPQYRQRFDAHPAVSEARRQVSAAGGTATGPAPAGIARLLEINRELNQRGPLEQLLERILEGAIELSGAERGFILLAGGREGRGKKLRLVAARSVEGERIRRGMAKLSSSIAEEALRARRTVLVADARQDERFRARLSVSGLDLVAVLCVPLSASGELWGALYLDNRFRPDVFGTETVALAEAFAEQAGIALVNARLLEQASRRGEQLAEAKAELERLNRRLEDELARQSATLSEMRVRLDHQEEELVRRFNAAKLVGRSKPMRALFGQLERITRADLPVVIQGESGTGKELVARALHQQGPPRPRSPSSR
jgi:serine/threonine-protein kinase PknK